MLESTSIEARRLNITDDRQGSSLEHVISMMNSNSGQVRTTHFSTLRDKWDERLSGWWCNNHLEKYESQWEGLSHILRKIKVMFETTNQL